MAVDGGTALDGLGWELMNPVVFAALDVNGGEEGDLLLVADIADGDEGFFADNKPGEAARLRVTPQYFALRASAASVPARAVLGA